MALVGEAVLDSPILASALERVPEAEVRLEEIRALPGGRLQFLVWARECDLPRFEAAIATDETVKSFRLLTDVGERRLYRLALSETGQRASTYLAAADEDIVVLDLTVTVDGVRVLARIPSREALRNYAEACQERGVDFQLQRLYEEEPATNDGGGGQQFDLTESQREALRCALEMGYFEVPRETSVSEMAERLEISNQALSTLLRRAEKRLIRNTVAGESI